MLKVVPFTNCCGMYIIHGFGQATTAAMGSDTKKEDVESQLLDILNSSIYKRTALIIALNSEQRPHFVDLLKKYGFVQKNRFLYSGHGNKIYTFIKNPQEDKDQKPNFKPFAEIY